jgi:subtilase-type serine protease
MSQRSHQHSEHAQFSDNAPDPQRARLDAGRNRAVSRLATLRRLRRPLLGTTALVGVAFAVFGGIGSAQAQNFVWVGANNDYNSLVNWTGAGSPPPDVAGETAAFENTGNAAIMVTGTVSPDVWIFANNSQSYTISGGTVNFGSAIGIFAITSAAAITINTQVSGIGSVLNDGGGGSSLTITNATNNFSGPVGVTAGTLAFNTSGSMGAVGGSVSVDGGVLDMNGVLHTKGQLAQTGGTVQNGTMNVGTYFLLGGTLAAGTTINASTTFILQSGTANGVLGGAGGATKSSSGTATFSGANTYTGGTIVQAGTLVLAGAGTLGDAANSLTVQNTGVLDLGGTAQTQNGGITLASGGTITDGTLNGAAISTGGTLNSIAGNLSLTANGGTTNLSGANSYTGATTVNNGATVIGLNANAFSAASATTIHTNGIVNLGGFAQTINAVSLSGGTLTNGALTGAVTSTGGTVNNIAGGASLTANGGTTNLTGANSFTGASTVNNGATLAGNNANAFSQASVLTVNTGGVASFGGFLQTIDNVTLAGGTLFAGQLAGAIASNGGTLNTIGGSASLNANAGTTNLVGAINYTGATAVNNGATLFGANVNAFAANSVTTINTGGTVDLGGVFQTINTVFLAGGTITNGALSGGITSTGGTVNDLGGSATLAANGGTTNVTGVNTYSGGTFANAGLLAVNGSITSAVMVNNGGTLGGNGTVGTTTVNSGGTLAPGNSIGAISIAGNLVLGAGAIYRVEVSPADADFTNVSGTAQLAGTVQLVFGPGAYTSRNYTILTAAGGRSGTFDSVQTFNLPPALQASLSYTSTDVLLVTLTSGISLLPGLTPNQLAVGAAQDAAFNGGLPSISALFGLAAAQLPGALDQLSGEVHASTASVLVDESLYARSAILGRLRQASYGGNTQMAALATGGPQAFAAEGGEAIESALAYGKSPIVRKAPMAAPQPTSDVVFWAQGFGAWGRFAGDSNAASVRRDLAGFFTGIDTRVAGNGRIGIAAGYTGSKNNLDGRGSANVETGHIAGYGGWGFGSLNLRAGGNFAFHSIATDRTIAFPGFFDRTFANYDGHTGQVFGELGYGFVLANLAVEPFAGAAWVRLKTDAAAERGGAAALSVAGTTFETGYTTLGIRAAGMVPVGHEMVLIPRASLAWQHAFDSVTPNAVLAFQTAPAIPFAISGVPIARDALLAEAGLDLAIGRNATVGVSYTGQIARNVHDHAAKGKFSWRF